MVQIGSTQTRSTAEQQLPGVFSKAISKVKNLALLAALLLLWQFGSSSLLDETTRTLLPPPTAVFSAAWELIKSGELFRNLLDSLRRELVAFLWALTAIPLGIAMGW